MPPTERTRRGPYNRTTDEEIEIRNKKIVDLYVNKNLAVSVLAVRFNLSSYSISRILSEARQSSDPGCN
jgi:DNA-binding transcriptional regulator LsrR (DeoR family)